MELGKKLSMLAREYGDLSCFYKFVKIQLMHKSALNIVIPLFSSGKPSEKNLYSDIESAWTALRTQYGVSPENIILYGQSIGTVPTVDLASRYEVAAVVLHSALMSGMRVAFPQTKRTWFFDAFPR